MSKRRKLKTLSAALLITEFRKHMLRMRRAIVAMEAVYLELAKRGEDVEKDFERYLSAEQAPKPLPVDRVVP